MTALALKWLDADLRSCHGGRHQWVPGEWVRVTPPVIPCRHGIHVCDPTDPAHTLRWISARAAWVEIEPEGMVRQPDKLGSGSNQDVTERGAV